MMIVSSEEIDFEEIYSPMVSPSTPVAFAPFDKVNQDAWIRRLQLFHLVRSQGEMSQAQLVLELGRG
jgi:hypothetical protein